MNKAQQDLEAAAWLLESPQALNNAVGFHCQQAAEKVLKAYLTWQDEPFEKTHSLVALVGLCLKFTPDFNELRTAATLLTPYAVTTRYPGDLPEISTEEAVQALDLAKQTWEFILHHLPALERIIVPVTQGAINNGYLPIGKNRKFYPSDAFGSSNARQGMGKLLRLHISGIHKIVETDIVKEKGVFRDRKWGEFYEHFNLRAGNKIAIEKISAYEYKVYPWEE